ncbi:MmyB family transcriptional regulator [Streptomyces triculaminicus]|uniref:MmyB family transcriptional regulator n=1 Tax=Streptomyces triculaminicus TaxID=2816232 RepID=UPI0037D4F19E
MNSQRVGQILSRARMRTEPRHHPQLAGLRSAHGLPERGVGSGRHVPYLNQQEVDLLLGYEPGRDVYARLERGAISNPPERLLRGVAEILRVGEVEWNELHIALYGHKAPRPLNPDSGLAVARTWAQVIHDTPGAAYISNIEWEVLDYNPAAAALFNPMPSNIMRWMLSLPPNEGSRTRMPDWEKSWGPVALSQLRAALAEAPGNPTLRQIEIEVLSDSELSTMYCSGLDPYLHPDGTLRLMYNPTVGKVGLMEAAAAEPMGSPGARVIFMHWTPLP